MKKFALPSLLFVSLGLVTSSAAAQSCPPGSWLCAGANVGGVGGSFSIGGGVVAQVPQPPVKIRPPPPPPPPQTVYVEQPVYVQQPVYVAQPVYVQQPIYQPAPVYVQNYQWVGAGRNSAFGLGAFATGLTFGGRGSQTSGLGGAGLTARFRYGQYLGTEVAVAGLYGTDYNGDLRTEIPASLNELIYFNPQNRLQVYALLGVGMSFAGVQYQDGRGAGRGHDTASYTYAGGQAGLGLEWQLTRNFSLFTDARAFIRTRIDADASTNPEFTRVNGGVTQTSNTSFGVTGQLGAIFYF